MKTSSLEMMAQYAKVSEAIIIWIVLKLLGFFGVIMYQISQTFINKEKTHCNLWYIEYMYFETIKKNGFLLKHLRII